MRGKGYRRIWEKASQQWHRLRFNSLSDNELPSPSKARLRLPVLCTSTAGMQVTGAVVDLQLCTNSPIIEAALQRDYAPSLESCPAAAASSGGEAKSLNSDEPRLLASSELNLHVGAPVRLGSPKAIDIEAARWADGVMRGEAYAYHHFWDAAASDNFSTTASSSVAPPRGSSYLSPVRWLTQPLLDGFVAQRLAAHTGVTTAALLAARRTAAAFGQQPPPFALSPYYASSEWMDRWCLFGEAALMLPTDAATSLQDPQSHWRRSIDLAIASAVLPNLNAAWLNGAVVVNHLSGRAVLIVGPPRCGKTTLALHCLAASKALMLTAAENVILGAGTALRRSVMQGRADAAGGDDAPAPAALFFCAAPHPVRVGLGAVLGTLRPNPSLAAQLTLPEHLQTQAGMHTFLANTDGTIWNMSKTYLVDPDVVYGRPSRQPATVSLLAGVVLLDWNVEELHSRAPLHAHTRMQHIPLRRGGIDELLHRSGDDKLLKGHHLLSPVYNGVGDGAERLHRILREELEAPSTVAGDEGPHLHRVGGSVNFDAATELIVKLLSQ